MKAGMISAASMTEYQRWEKGNMLDSKKVEYFLNLTPRLQLIVKKNQVYRNINDLNAKLSYTEKDDEIIVKTQSRLVNGEQNAPDEETHDVFIDYKIKKDIFSIEIGLDKKVSKGKLLYIFPVICSAHDNITLNDDSFKLEREEGVFSIQSNYKLAASIGVKQRVYNFVPGLQAFPLEIDCSEIHKEKLVLNFLA
jgi:hypothetical protein